MWSNEHCVEGDDNFSGSTVCVLVNTAQDAVGHLCCWLMLILLTPRTSRVFSTELCPSQGDATLFQLYLFRSPLPLLLTWSWSLKVPAVLQMDGTKWVSSQKGWDSLGLQMLQGELRPLCNGCSRTMCVVGVRSVNKVSAFPSWWMKRGRLLFSLGQVWGSDYPHNFPQQSLCSHHLLFHSWGKAWE